MFHRYRWGAAVLLGLVLALVLRSRWQPAKQVRFHTEALVAAVGSKSWGRLEGLLADDYSDAWGHDKPTVLGEVREVFQQFFALELKAPQIDVEEPARQGIARARLTLRGRGGPLAEIAVQRMSDLREPFTFTWRKRSWKPW